MLFCQVAAALPPLEKPPRSFSIFRRVHQVHLRIVAFFGPVVAIVAISVVSFTISKPIR